MPSVHSLKPQSRANHTLGPVWSRSRRPWRGAGRCDRVAAMKRRLPILWSTLLALSTVVTDHLHTAKLFLTQCRFPIHLCDQDQSTPNPTRTRQPIRDVWTKATVMSGATATPNDGPLPVGTNEIYYSTVVPMWWRQTHWTENLPRPIPLPLESSTLTSGTIK